MSNIKHKYTSADIQYIKSNLEKDGLENVASHLGIKKDALKMRISHLRRKGIQIPLLNYCEVGSITERKDRGVIRKFIKTQNGWKRLEPRIKKEKPAKIPKVKMEKVLATPKHAAPHQKVNNEHARKLKGANKKSEKRFATKTVNLSERQPIYIPRLKMTVYASLTANRDKVIEKYMKHHEFTHKQYAHLSSVGR